MYTSYFFLIKKSWKDLDYGKSKKAAEDVLEKLCLNQKHSVSVFQFPNIFGKWSRPNYNSAVVTFCYNIARKLPITVHKRDAPLELIYVDDAVDQIIGEIYDLKSGYNIVDIKGTYHTTVGSVADTIIEIHNLRSSFWLGDYSDTLFKKLHAIYLAYLPVEAMALPIVAKSDSRGKFIEFCKSYCGGQVSLISILKGQKRGGHYHHTKVEKFVVLSGEVEFRFLI